jgi:hypothetical protein
MLALVLCGASFCITFAVSRCSLKSGLGIVMLIGYFYGIVRANVPQVFSHFIFDATVTGLYLALWLRGLSPVQRIRTRAVRQWLVLLVSWPVLLFFVPFQEPLVQLVGLRGVIWFLPFLLIGAILEDVELRALSLCLAALNLAALTIAGMEFFWGISGFFPNNAVTQIIYGSHDVAGFTQYRIPATFVNAAAYSGVMTITLPLLVGAWTRKDKKAWESWLLIGSLGGTLIGVFLGASRSQAGILFMQIAFLLSLGEFRSRRMLGVVLIGLSVAWVVAQHPRLQRFGTLGDVALVRERIGESANGSFIEAAAEFPLGNGLGGGGTSLPYFLQGKVQAPLVLENEYGRILIEEGLPGLCLWILFLIWALGTPPRWSQDSWQVGRSLAWFTCLIYFGTAFIGLGLLSAVPGTSMLLLLVGWTAAPRIDAIRRFRAGSASGILATRHAGEKYMHAK